MIITQQKDISEIFELIKPYNKLFKPLQINAINSWYNLNVDKTILINTEFKEETEEYFSDKLH